MKDNKFKVFKKAKDKRSDILDANADFELLESRVGRFRYFPPRVFNKLRKQNCYAYLENGLYIQENKITISPEVKKYSAGIKNLDNYLDGLELNNIEWSEAKKLSHILGGKLLTPAELFCVKKVLNLKQRMRV